MWSGSHLFRKPAEIRKGLVEGLEQAEVDCFVPEVHVFRNLDNFLERELPALYPDNRIHCHKLIAHPLLSIRDLGLEYRYPESKRISELVPADFNKSTSAVANSQSMQPKDIQLQSGLENEDKANQLLPSVEPERRLLIAVGPEGGWEEDEIMKFQEKGFHLVHMGDRILRTDMAVSECRRVSECVRTRER